MQGQKPKAAFNSDSPKKTGSPTARSKGDDSYNQYFSGKDGAKQQGVLNRALNNLNPFKSKKAGGGWFNPEEYTSQKREWAKHFGGDNQPAGETHKLFESFFIAGLPPSTDVKCVTADTHTTKTARQDHVHMRFSREASKETEHRGSRGEAMDAQVLYSFPPDKPVTGAVAAYCFPHGVNPVLLERTPSMSSLNEIIYGQRFLHSDACSFVFLMKVADDLPLYGVCCYMEELVHRPPAILSGIYETSPAPLSRYLVSAPRCYCLLTRYPFFSLHLKVLHMIMGLERLDRITAFTEEASRVPESPFQETSQAAFPPPPKAATPSRENGKKVAQPPPSPPRPGLPSMPSRVSAPSETRATSQVLAEAIKRASTGSQEVPQAQAGEDSPAARPASFSGPQKATRPSHRRSNSAMTTLPPMPSAASSVEPRRLSSSLSRASARMRLVIDKQEAAVLRSCEETEGAEPTLPELEVPEPSEASTASFQTTTSGFATVEDLNNSLSPIRMRHSNSAGALSRMSAPSSPWDERTAGEQRGPGPPPGGGGREGNGAHPSLGDTAGPTRSAPSFRTLLKSQSLRPHLTETQHREGEAPAGAMQVMQAYYDAPVPQPGQDFEFSADDTLQPVHYYRSPPHLEGGAPEHVHRTQIANAEAEAAEGLRSWTVAVLCRCLSLENVLLLLTAVLLEQQVVVFCPNIGLLSTAVLSLIPLLRPFAWQSLLMPVLPALDQMLDLMDAPVPFVLGVQYKTSEIASRCTGLVRVNIYKDTVVNAERLPPLPGAAALHSMLEPAYAMLRSVSSEAAHSRPTYNVTDVEKRAAVDFLTTTEGYLGGLCSKLHLHAITDVQTGDRVAVLLKDSYIESFDAKDRNFARMFVETQMFEVYCDTTMM